MHIVVSVVKNPDLAYVNSVVNGMYNKPSVYVFNKVCNRVDEGVL